MEQNLRQQLLASAKELFMVHGYEQVGMREIAQTIGCQPTQLYRLNLSKSDILAELIIELNEEQIQLQAVLCTSIKGESVLERISAYLLELYRLDIHYLPLRSVGAAFGWMWPPHYEAQISAQTIAVFKPIENLLIQSSFDDISARCYMIRALYHVGFRMAVIEGASAEACLAGIHPSLKLVT